MNNTKINNFHKNNKEFCKIAGKWAVETIGGVQIHTRKVILQWLSDKPATEYYVSHNGQHGFRLD